MVIVANLVTKKHNCVTFFNNNIQKMFKKQPLKRNVILYIDSI